MKSKVVLFASALAVSLGSARPASAEAPVAEDTATTEARQHFADGLRLYKDGDFDAALVQFERAYEKKPNPRVLYNIAQTYFQLREYVEAREAMSRYLEEAGSAIEPERRAQATNDLAQLQKRIAKISLTVNVAGATVLVDGKKVGTTPLAAPLEVSEGVRTISVETPDGGARQRVVRIAGGESQSIAIQLVETQQRTPDMGAAPASPRPAAPPPARALPAGFWISAVSAAALGAGAGVTGFLALKAHSDNKDLQSEPNISQDALGDSATRAKRFALATDILAGGALVCGGVAVFVAVTNGNARQETARTELTVGLGSVRLSGAF
jgi:hypothetical protein